MASFQFYAAPADLDDVLVFIFDVLPVRVFETNSRNNERLVEFRDPQAVKARCPVGRCATDRIHSASLSLLVRRGAGRFVRRRINFTGGYRKKAKFRYDAAGWGLIHLHLGGLGPTALVRSWGGVNSEKRARNWEPYSPELGSVNDWDWTEVSRVSNKLGRYVRSTLAMGRLAGCPVLKHAAALHDQGTPIDREDLLDLQAT